MRSRIASGTPGPLSSIATASASRCRRRGERDVARDARDRAGSAESRGRARERLRGVAHDVERRLRQLLGIGVELRAGSRRSRADRDLRETRPARRPSREPGSRGCWCGDTPAAGAASAADSTSDCRRSASPMITCVYSEERRPVKLRARAAARRRESRPSGFLISCARLRISSRFACCCSSRRSSRAILSCWSMWRNSSSSAALVIDRRARCT